MVKEVTPLIKVNLVRVIQLSVRSIFGFSVKVMPVVMNWLVSKVEFLIIDKSKFRKKQVLKLVAVLLLKLVGIEMVYDRSLD